MSFADYKSKSADQLKEQLLQLRKEQMNLRFQKAAGQMATPNRWREVRKSISRVLTAITQAAKPAKTTKAKKGA